MKRDSDKDNWDPLPPSKPSLLWDPHTTPAPLFLEPPALSCPRTFVSASASTFHGLLSSPSPNRQLDFPTEDITPCTLLRLPTHCAGSKPGCFLLAWCLSHRSACQVHGQSVKKWMHGLRSLPLQQALGGTECVLCCAWLYLGSSFKVGPSLPGLASPFYTKATLRPKCPETLVGSKGTSPDLTVLPVYMGTSVPGTSPSWHLEEP